MVATFIMCFLSLLAGAAIFAAGFYTCKKFISVQVTPIKEDDLSSKVDIQEEMRKKLYMDMLGQFDPISPKEMIRDGIKKQ